MFLFLQGLPVSSSLCYEKCLHIISMPNIQPKVLERVYQCLGQISISMPSLLAGPESSKWVQRSLSETANPALTRVGLYILLDLLNSEAAKLDQAQKERQKATSTKKATKRKKKEESELAIPCQNGELDNLSVGSNILQVCDLSTLTLTFNLSLIVLLCHAW